jgi:hypothetical protein
MSINRTTLDQVVKLSGRDLMLIATVVAGGVLAWADLRTKLEIKDATDIRQDRDITENRLELRAIRNR